MAHEIATTFACRSHTSDGTRCRCSSNKVRTTSRSAKGDLAVQMSASGLLYCVRSWYCVWGESRRERL